MYHVLRVSATAWSDPLTPPPSSATDLTPVVARPCHPPPTDVLRVLRLMRELECEVGIDTLTEQVLPGMETAVTWDKLLYELNNIGVRYSAAAPALCRYLLNQDQLPLANAVADR